MNGDLVPKEEYYRPQRAAELRGKSARMACWPAYLGALWVGVLCALAVFNPPEWVAAAAACLLALVSLCSDFAQERATRLGQQAVTLEAEHQARYGELPDPDPDE